ncbi:hypothetical protein APED_25560 [Acanthopleuribacter pedis]
MMPNFLGVFFNAGAPLLWRPLSKRVISAGSRIFTVMGAFQLWEKQLGWVLCDQGSLSVG